jgi:hypothetical protein
MYRAEFPYDYYFYDNKGRPLFNASIYIGAPNLDPEIPANQIDVYGQQEDGTSVLLSQPISTNSGGGATYNGSPIVLLLEEESYSLKVLDSLGVQVYYNENVESVLTSSTLSELVITVNTYADFADLNAKLNQVYFLKCHTEGNLGAGFFKGVPIGSLVPDDGLISATATAGVYAQRFNFTAYTPEMFGCISTSTDIEATRAINKAYAAALAAGGGAVRYEQLSYPLNGTIDGTSDISATGTRGGIQVKSNTVTIFDGQVFTQSASSSANYSLINCSRQSNFVIEGTATFIGDALIHLGVGGEFGHGLYLADSHDFKVSGLRVETCWGDGCYFSCTDESTPELGVSTSSSNGVVADCIFDGNRRQGASGINSQDIVFERCQFINTGNAGVATAPAAGVDLEPDASPNSLGLRRITFNDCLFDNNAGPNLLVFPNIADGCIDISINNCHLLRTDAQGSYWSDRGAANVKNVVVNGGIIQGGVYSGNGTTFNNVKISRSMDDPGVSSYVLEHTNGTFGAKYNNCEIRAIGDTTVNSKRLYFSGTNSNDLDKTQFSKCKFIGEDIYGTATNVLMVINAPTTFTDCEFSTEGADPVAYVGFDTTPGSSRLTPSYAMLYNCYFESTWHIGFPGFQGRVDLETVKVRSLTFIATNLVPLSAADVFEFLYTGNGANSIANPTDPYPKIFHIRIKNTSGVATTAPTFGSAYKLQAAWTQPAAGQNRTITFYHDGTAAYEISRTTADVPN